jgi:hypothetical protein
MKLIHNLRVGLNRALNGETKIHSVLDYLCMDPKCFRIHIESKFSPNWTWSMIEMDHIIPVNYFDHSNEREIQKCWHWSNFQPLLRSDNSAKQDTLPTDFKRRKWKGKKIGWIVVPE